MGHRHELQDAEWQLIAELMPPPGGVGRPWNDHRAMINGMLWVLRTGAPWRDLPERLGRWQSVYHRFSRWRRDGTLERLVSRLQERLDEQGHLDWDLWCVDGSHVRGSKAAAGGGKRGALKNRRITV